MGDARRTIGEAAEDEVARRLSCAESWGLVERNARTRYGELDIVALHGEALVFIEVKAGRVDADLGPVRPVHAVGPQKQRRIRRLATAWMAERRDLPRYRTIRFDAVGVSFDRDLSVVDYEHIEGAF